MENVSQLSNLPARLKRPPKTTLKSQNSTRVVPYEAKRSCITNHTQATGKTSKAEQTPSYAHKTANCKTHRVAPSQDDAQVSNFYTPPRHGGCRLVHAQVLQTKLTSNSTLQIAWVGIAQGGAIAANMKGVSMPRSDNCFPTLFHRKKGKKFTQR